MVSNSDVDARQSYEEWHSLFPVDVEANTPWHKMLRRYLLPEQHLADKRVLEIGCGRGGFSCWLASQPQAPRQIVAADFSTAAVQMGQQYARRMELSGITWEVADIQSIAHPDCSFDTIISTETIEHVPQPSQALAELSRLLRPGGRLFLTTPNYLGPIGLYRLYLSLRGRKFTEEGQPINNFMLFPLTQKCVRRSGLRILTATTVGHYLPFPRRPPVEIPLPRFSEIFTRWFGLHCLIVAEKPVV